MAITAQIGTTPEYCFIADGRNLLVYIANGYARNTLTGTPANNDTVTIDTVYYKFTNASVDAGTPAGTLANPCLWLLVRVLPQPSLNWRMRSTSSYLQELTTRQIITNFLLYSLIAKPTILYRF